MDNQIDNKTEIKRTAPKVKYKFREGEEVAHVDNPELKMYVERLVKSSRTIDDGPNGKKVINYIQGVRCHWWQGTELKANIFHTKELVPFVVAEEGFIAIEKWIAKNR